MSSSVETHNYRVRSNCKKTIKSHDHLHSVTSHLWYMWHIHGIMWLVDFWPSMIPIDGNFCAVYCTIIWSLVDWLTFLSSQCDYQHGPCIIHSSHGILRLLRHHTTWHWSWVTPSWRTWKGTVSYALGRRGTCWVSPTAILSRRN